MKNPEVEQVVAAQLLAAPSAIADRELALCIATNLLEDAKEALADREAALLLGEVFAGCDCITPNEEGGSDPFSECERCGGSGRFILLIDGKNETIRAAQVRDASRAQRLAAIAHERGVAEAKRLLNFERNRFAAARALAGLLHALDAGTPAPVSHASNTAGQSGG